MYLKYRIYVVKRTQYVLVEIQFLLYLILGFYCIVPIPI